MTERCRRSAASTAEQRDAIERRDGDLLLDAGAGQRQDLGARRALRARGARGRRRRSRRSSRSPSPRRRRPSCATGSGARLRELGADEEARATEGAFISTIHGFCARVLRAHALAAGLDPALRRARRARGRSGWPTRAFDEALEELAARRARRRRPDRGVRAGGAAERRSWRCYAELRSRGADRAAAAAAAARARLEAARRALRARRPRRRRRARRRSPSPASGCWRRSERLGAARGARARGRRSVAGRARRLELPGGNGAALSTPACEAYREALGALPSGLRARAARGAVHGLLGPLLRAFGERYARRKRARSGSTSRTSSCWRATCCASDAELRERYRERFARIMVDELQDTNRVQLELIELARPRQPVHGRRRPAVDLRLPPRRRRAVRALAASSSRRRGARATLQTNFRSRPEILECSTAPFEPAARRAVPAARGRARRGPPAARAGASSCWSPTRAPTGSPDGLARAVAAGRGARAGRRGSAS